MCKGCNKVFGVLDMKNGYCKDCLAAEKNPKYTTLSVENNTSEFETKKDWYVENQKNLDNNGTEEKKINDKGNKMNKNVAIISIVGVIALTIGFFIGHVTSDRYYFMKERYSNGIIIFSCDKFTGDVQKIFKPSK